jgi:hypothetical protein
MDLAVVTSFLSPFLPMLVKLGGKAANTALEQAAKQFGEAAWKKAEATWAKLKPELEQKEAGREALADLQSQPEDSANVVVLLKQVQKLLARDQDLAAEITAILRQNAADGTPGMQIVQNVTGSYNQVVGQVTGGVVINQISGGRSRKD